MNYLIKVWKDPWIDIDAPFVIEYYGSTLWSNFSAKFNSVSDYNVKDSTVATYLLEELENMSKNSIDEMNEFVKSYNLDL